jgi:hypothetical protein
MHDIDRTQLEMGWETDEFGYEGEEELYREYETFDEAEGEGEFGGAPGIFNEMDEMELAAQLLEVSDEAELDQFLGSLLKKARRAVGGALRANVGNGLGGILKGIAKKTLPMAGSALGNLIAPGAGGQIGGQLASSASKLFGLELEGLSAEDQEFEVARRFVRLAGSAVENAAQAPPNTAPAAVAQNAVAAAAQQHAPGLLKPSPATNGAMGKGVKRQSGRWIRRGKRIVLLGV